MKTIRQSILEKYIMLRRILKIHRIQTYYKSTPYLDVFYYPYYPYYYYYYYYYYPFK